MSALQNWRDVELWLLKSIPKLITNKISKRNDVIIDFDQMLVFNVDIILAETFRSCWILVAMNNQC